MNDPAPCHLCSHPTIMSLQGDASVGPVHAGYAVAICQPCLRRYLAGTHYNQVKVDTEIRRQVLAGTHPLPRVWRWLRPGWYRAILAGLRVRRRRLAGATRPPSQAALSAVVEAAPEAPVRLPPPGRPTTWVAKDTSGRAH